ncbi:MAG: hypothetical protein H6827_00335, partial [Planctomycetes bacterium]|nr:hypothetical protein [Planctomycetota bacterium]
MNRTKSPATVQESHAIDYIGLRGLFLKLFLGFLGLTAVVAIVSVLSGDFGKVQAKVLATCFTVSAASICSMSCAAFMEKRKHVRLGMTGIALSIGSGLLVIVGLWPEIDAEEYLKTTATVCVAGIAFAYIFLLLIPELDVRHRWLQRVFAGSVGILAV